MYRIVIFFILALFLSSCGANYHLRRAKHHIKKAELRGALWTSDTVFKKLDIKVRGIEVKFTPKILTAGKPMVFEKDSVITKVLIVPGKSGVDTVYVDTKCPDRVITKIVPVEVNNTIKAEKSFWQKIGNYVFVAIVFLVLGYVLRSQRQIIIQTKKE